MRRTKGLWHAGARPDPSITTAEGMRWIDFDMVPAARVPGSITGIALGFRLKDGRWVCSGACITVDDDLGTRLWRSVPVSLLVSEARAAARLVGTKLPKLPKTRPQRGSRGPDQDFYRDVAELYRHLVADGVRDPVVRIAELLKVPGDDPIEQTRRWIRTARRLGFLRASIAGKPGEAASGRRTKPWPPPR
jgi:hypothetical protein